MAAYLEKRKTILQTANQCVERGDRSDDGYNIPGAAPKISEDVVGDDNNIHLMVRERRQRKSSFISKSLNDPKLLEVNTFRTLEATAKYYFSDYQPQCCRSVFKIHISHCISSF